MVLCTFDAILSQKERYEIGGICMFTASIGFTGAALQLKSLRQFRNRQRRRLSSNPDIIFYLALADLICCVGVIASVTLLLDPEKPNMPQRVFEPFDAVTEIIRYFGVLASQVWTFCFALDMCFQLYEIECAMVVYHILAWVIPLELIVVMEGARFYHGSVWCQSGNVLATRLVLTYMTTMFVIVANPVIFYVTYRKVKQLLRSSGRYTNDERAALHRYRRRVFWMVIIFIGCWLPSATTSSTLFLRTFENENHHEINKSQIAIWYFTLSVIPLQGIFNYFLYRRAFRVTATDTRRGPNSLPRVRRQNILLERERGRMLPSSPKGNQSVPKNNATLNRSKETAPLVTSRGKNENPTCGYVYTSRLLGE